MAAENFPASLAKVLVHEGGWSNHPDDSGGATMKGVIQRVYDAYRRRKGKGLQSVRYINGDELTEIYRGQYWSPIYGDELPKGVDYCVFDGAVNSGPSQAAKWLQRALGRLYTGRVDGWIGTLTLDAVDRHPDKAALIRDICKKRLSFMQVIRNRKTGKLLWPIFGRGWKPRVESVERDALKMLAT